MSSAVVTAIRDKIIAEISPEAAPTIVWHAGEPTVVPLDWYKSADAALRRAAPARTKFSLQSNGVFLSEDWISFLKDTRTHIGLSIDGPEAIHDYRRKTRGGRGTWSFAIKTLKKLQDAGIWPSVVSVLHPRSLGAANEYFDFYRSHAITHVSLSIDEVEGAHATSSFQHGTHEVAIRDFLFRLLEQAFVDEYPLHIKEIERIADVLVNGAADNEQVKPWDVMVVAANGDVTTFSPEFMEVRSLHYDNFRFGNILEEDFRGLVEKIEVAVAHADIQRGVARCQAECAYFSVCGGGAPANKFEETGSLDSAETLFCRLSVQAAAEALRKFLQWSACANATADVVHGASWIK